MRWNLENINRLMKNLRDTGTVNRLTGGRLAAYHEENVDLVNDLALTH